MLEEKSKDLKKTESNKVDNNLKSETKKTKKNIKKSLNNDKNIKKKAQDKKGEEVIKNEENSELKKSKIKKETKVKKGKVPKIEQENKIVEEVKEENQDFKKEEAIVNSDIKDEIKEDEYFFEKINDKNTEDKKKVLIVGGSGLLGRKISSNLSKNGYRIYWMSREPKSTYPFKTYYWDPYNEQIDKNFPYDFNVVINLCGENIADKKWKYKRKKILVRSRLQTTKYLVNLISNFKVKPELLINSSAVGYYGNDSQNNLKKENDESGNDFLSKLCFYWEKEALKVSEEVRLICLRIGTVLTIDGGILKKLEPLAKKGLLIPLGSGNQNIAWIHINDLADLILHCIENKNINGPLNAVANNISNKEFFKLLLKSYNKVMLPLKIPGFILKMFMGELSLVILNGNMISNEKILESGFKFNFSNISIAFNTIISNKNKRYKSLDFIDK